MLKYYEGCRGSGGGEVALIYSNEMLLLTRFICVFLSIRLPCSERCLGSVMPRMSFHPERKRPTPSTA
jgi:hypothetical protein